MIWIGLLLSLVSCKDTMEAIGLGGDEIPAEGLVLNIDLPNFLKSNWARELMLRKASIRLLQCSTAKAIHI